MSSKAAMPGDTSPVVQMKGITKRFPGVLASDHVDCHLFRGEVLALLGENGAGKSTLMNVLVGLYRPDEGEIRIDGRHAEIRSPRDASTLGIGMVHQNFMLVHSMTVAENVILGLGSLPPVPDLRAIGRRVGELGERYNLRVDPSAFIWQLGVGEQQRVEILKLIYRGARILILDEPTAVLTPQESHELNRVIRRMVEEGKSAIFITHKMEEVMAFSDRVQVLRKGKSVAVRPTHETDPGDLARLMVGREVLFRLEKAPCARGELVLALRDVHAQDDKGNRALNAVSFEVYGGEIFGIAGVAGNGQRALAEVITGLRKATEGRVSINGKDMTNRTPLEMIRAGVSHIPADRIAMGVVGAMSVSDNLAMKGYRKPPIRKSGMLRRKKILEFARRLVEMFQIVTPGLHTLVKFLSGGNIQKTILAREIDSCGKLLVAGYPSRGLDVGATETVRRRLLRQREEGCAVLLISEDLEELLGISDRIAVMFEGRIMDILRVEEAAPEHIGLLMAGVEQKK
jgi:ABC-type uncharacterized transport system ATPase subunit